MEEVTHTQPLITKYRPKQLSDVLGQDEVVKSLKKVLSKNTAQAFLFVGPSGTGKTTLARIIAHVKLADILEVDAATYSGVDDVRELVRPTSYGSLSGRARVYVIDECHTLSKQAWQALLKAIEEPPKNLYYVFLTTEEGKVPPTIKNRCVLYSLSPVDDDVLYSLLLDVNEKEKLKTSEDVLDLIANKAGGSPRKALSMLVACSGMKDVKKAGERLREVTEGDDSTLAFCRALTKSKNRAQLVRLLEKTKGVAPESIRINVYNYFTAVAFGTKKDEGFYQAMSIIQAFGEPYPQQAGMGHLLLSLAEYLYEEE